GRAGVLIVKHHQRLAAQRGVALHDVNVADEGRVVVLVAHLEAGRGNSDWLIAVLRKALQRILHALRRRRRPMAARLRGGGPTRRGHHDGNGREAGEISHVPGHCLLRSPDKLKEPPSMSSVTPPSNRITSPSTARRLALRIPLSSFTST